MDDTEKRRFFRIDDYISFDYFIAQTSEQLSNEAIRNRLLNVETKEYQALTEKFKRMNVTVSDTRFKLEQKYPELMLYLNHLNKKVELVAQTLSPKKNTPLRPVNLSLRGMAFFEITPIKPETKLYIRLDLKPHNIPLILHAKIIHCEETKQKDGSYKIAVHFLNVTEKKEQLLNQHIMITQAASLHQQDKNDNEEDEL